ncbi:glycosyltransferase family A protein [Liquorilactobacillus oeni]|uniref:Glycosyltransferase 2-like domain-containing protein n=1 Tax=Liquorilactobacillus oeni DSM 19972 TaxID=1423777 RepID=A0A0R1M8Z4_9LACO|nr:glycosyltransferase family 2 protein [Liquorilactobacillus oeni]KRL04534.1 hypothetical protein FD46_GL001665 [Liquorilactobacillus oeni DSM 19972]
METNNLVTIIIPVYNCEKYLKRCLDSVEKQTYKNLQIIIIDDGSTDNSMQICRKWKSESNRNISIIKQFNSGVSIARNTGLQAATGTFVTFIDGDDYIESNYIKFLVKQFNAQEHCDLSICGLTYEDERGDVILESNNERIIYDDSQDIIRDSFKINLFQGFVIAKMFRLDIIKRNDVFFNKNISVYEDHLFCYQYMKNISFATYDGTSLYHYVNHKNSSIKKKPSLSDAAAYEIMLDFERNQALEFPIICAITRIFIRSYPSIKKIYFKKNVQKKLKQNTLIFLKNKVYGNKLKLALLLEIFIPVKIFNFLFKVVS